MKKKILIIGGSSGTGFFLIKKYIEKKYDVYSTFFKNRIKKGLIEINKTYKLDISSKKSVLKFLNKISNIKFDIVIFLAAKTNTKSNLKLSKFGNLNKETFNNYLLLNCFHNIKLFENLYKNKNIKRMSRIIFFSSSAGSIALRGKYKHHKKKGNLIYRISKAALNCAVRNLSYDFKNNPILINSIHPGFVNAGSGKNQGNMSGELFADEVYRTISKLRKEDAEFFINYDGKKLKW